MFKRLNSFKGEAIQFTFDDQPIEAIQGDTVAAALLLKGVNNTRLTPVSGSPRAPFCMMGTCYECLVVIDGCTVQACMTPAQPGLVVQRVPRPDSDNG